MRHGLSARRCLAFALLTGMGASVLADEAITEQAYLQEFPVVLTASRLAQHISEAPNATTVIDREMIKASGFRNIADLFRLVPGMYVGNVGANTPFVSLNGVTDQYSRRMQVLVDGRSVYLPPFGGVDWNDLPVFIDDIERIEVVRGPAAASHGSNSFYGVINILTRDAASMNHRSVTVSKGEMGISDVSARLGKSGEKFDYRVSFGMRSDGGDNPSVLHDTSANHLLTLRTNYRPLLSDSIEFQLGVSSGVYGQGTLGRATEAFRDIQIKNDFQQLAWTHSWDGGDESKLTFYRINRDYSDTYKCVDFVLCGASNPQGFAYDVARSQRQELELQNTTQLGASNRAVWGAGIRYDYADQPLIFATSHGLHQSRVFVHDEWRATEAVLFNLGTMYEDDGAGHTSTSPRLSVNYHVTPQHTLRALVSTATRNPMMAELYLQTATNKYWARGYTPPAGGLKPERILSKEIGYVGQFGALSVDGRIYYDYVRDIIFLDAYADLSNLADPKHSFKNLSDGTFKGLDISASYRWEEGRATANYSYQQASCAFSSYPTQYFHPILGPILVQGYQVDYLNLCSQSVPTHSGNLLLEQHLSESILFSTGIYLRGKVRVTDVASGFPPESPLRRVDMRIAKSFGSKDEAGGGEVAVIVQNAFQDNYTGYANVLERMNLLFKRRAYLTATINF
jgi:iron complex outermembrane receptor protein